MRRLLVLGAAIVGLLGITSIASADHGGPEINQAFFFGDCYPDDYYGSDQAAGAAVVSNGVGCRGFGIFFGEYTAATLADAILHEYQDKYDELAEVTRLYAWKVGAGTQFVPAIQGEGSEYDECSTATDQQAAPQLEGINVGGLWLAWFSIQPCSIRR